jgi:hypothetical protein
VRAFRPVVDHASTSQKGYPFHWRICQGASSEAHEKLKAKAAPVFKEHDDADTIPEIFPCDPDQPAPEFDEELATRIEEAEDGPRTEEQEAPAEESAAPEDDAEDGGPKGPRRSKRQKTGKEPDYSGKNAAIEEELIAREKSKGLYAAGRSRVHVGTSRRVI